MQAANKTEGRENKSRIRETALAIIGDASW